MVKLKKKDGYGPLASFVNKKCGTSWTVDAADARLRNTAYAETRLLEVSLAKDIFTWDRQIYGDNLHQKQTEAPLITHDMQLRVPCVTK